MYNILEIALLFYSAIIVLIVVVSVEKQSYYHDFAEKRIRNGKLLPDPVDRPVYSWGGKKKEERKDRAMKPWEPTDPD